MTRLDFSAFSTRVLEYRLQNLKELLASGTLTDRSALNQYTEIAGLEGEPERRSGCDIVREIHKSGERQPLLHDKGVALSR